MSPHEDKPIDTIHLTDDQKQKLVDQVNAHYHKPVPKERRDLRLPFAPDGASIAVLQPNGSTTRHAMLARNISTGGLSFMIGQYIYTGRDAVVRLPLRAGGVATVRCRTIRCNHFGGMIHECAVAFLKPVDLELYVAPALLPESSRTAAVPGSAGAAPAVLVLDDHPSDRQLYHLWMQKLGFTCVEAESLTTARQQMRKSPVELVLVSGALEKGDALEAVKGLRTDGFAGPVLMVSADNDPAARQRAIAAGVDEYLLKPFDQADLRHTLERMMAHPDTDDESRAVHSELADSDTMKPLLHEFIAGLTDTTSRLTAAGAAPDCDALGELCRKLKGAGSGYGFPQIARLAAVVVEQIELERRDVDAVRKSVDDLVALLKRVRAE